jgi:hypothetical protein
MANQQLTTFQDLLPHISTKESAIEFAMRHNLIAKTIDCPVGHQVNLKVNNMYFRCFRQGCKFNKSILNNTWFSNSHLTITQNLQIMYLWSMNVRQELITHEVKFGSPNTIINHCMMIREVFIVLGNEWQADRGPGKVVEIDESKYGKRKYNRGKRVEGNWVFGAIERRVSNNDPINVRLFLVADRTAETLISIIRNTILPGTTILSDCWASYNSIKNQDEKEYIHKTVNHSIGFKAPDGTCTNMIEGTWKHSKRMVGSGKRRHLTSYLAEFCWRKSVPKGVDIFLELLKIIAKYYPGKERAEVVNQEIVNESVYTIHKKGQVISWNDYIVSLQGQLEDFGTQDEDDETDNEAEEDVENSEIEDLDQSDDELTV